MRFPRTAVLAAGLALSLPLLLASLATAPPDAHASVSIAVAFDALVRESSAVALVTPVEQRSVWEEGRIYTYTRVRADKAVAGDMADSGEAWVRTMGGVVGKIGQLVEGEAVLTMGRPSLLFLRRGAAGTLEVTARAQGQFALTLDEHKNQRLARSSGVGVLLPPPQVKAAQAGVAQASALLLAHDALHDKTLDEGVRDIGVAWKRLHVAK